MCGSVLGIGAGPSPETPGCAPASARLEQDTLAHATLRERCVQDCVGEAKVAPLGDFGDPRARTCMHWVSDMYGHEPPFWHRKGEALI